MPLIRPRAKIVDRGTKTFSIANVQFDVTLNTPMPSSAYTVYTRLVSGASIALPAVSNKTSTGFRISVAVGVAATVEWVAIED